MKGTRSSSIFVVLTNVKKDSGYVSATHLVYDNKLTVTSVLFYYDKIVEDESGDCEK